MTAKIKTLFLNANSDKPQCAIYTAGRRYFAGFDRCETLDVKYVELGNSGSLPNPQEYDLVIVNYQHVSAELIPMEFYSYCPTLVGFTYEARLSPGKSPMTGGEWMDEVFDIVMSPDPTLETTEYIWAVPRIAPRIYSLSEPPISAKHPIISTFGLPSPLKRLDKIITMMNDEFTEGTFRLNFPKASHQEGIVNSDSQNDQDEDMLALIEEVKGLAKPGIDVVFTRHFMDESDLIQWLHMSDLNVFFSDESRAEKTGGALLASADIAISALKPLLVSDNLETRHLNNFVFGSLGGAIESQSLRLSCNITYMNWSPENFATRVDEMVREYL